MIAKECPKQIFVLAPVMFKGADEVTVHTPLRKSASVMICMA
jgi:hypothetical protein